MSAVPGAARQQDGETGPDLLAERVRERLRREMDEAHAEGMPRVQLRGQLIRPLAACAGLGGRALEEAPAGFWAAALAVQLAHEASLVHDDIVDGAASRRGEPTVVAARGTAAALVLGDHLLTAAYCLAARTGSHAFATVFAHAVERTVAGERAQGEATGVVLDFARYRAIAMAKSGELLGCALSAAAVLEGSARAGEIYELGRRIGLVYQMLDDLLDYCPRAVTGKPALGDYAQSRWTWPLLELGEVEFGRDPAAMAAALRAPASGGSGLRRALRRLEAEIDALTADLERELGRDPLLTELLQGWRARGGAAVAAEEAEAAGPAPAPHTVGLALRSRLPASGEVMGYLARHSRSFRFAARLFSPADAERVGRVYAFCRVTDDLVDRPEGADSRALLDEWEALARRAYDGHATGVGFLDEVMGEMAQRRIPFEYAAELVEGMRMDLRNERYATLADLRRYSYRVASVVGLWMTELFGVRDAWVLERAARMGHAMQLTNILRDVGEDARGGRLYLPLDRLSRHGLREEDIGEMARGARPVVPEFRALMEELLRVAEADYELAFAALPALPRALGRPAAVAGQVYRGIHAAIRQRGYDTLRQRAYTTAGTKVLLAARALWSLRAAARPAEAVLAATPAERA